MKPTDPQPPKVLVALMMSGKSGQDKLEGVFRFLQEGHHWDMRVIRTRKAFTPQVADTFRERGVSGLLFSLPADEEVEQRIERSDMPTVVIDSLDAKRLRNRTRNIAFVANDSRVIGARAAEYLLEQGVYRGFAYVGATRHYAWSQNRYEAFRDTLAARGFACRVFSDHVGEGSADWDRHRQALASWLRGLPKPCGLLAAYDDRGHQVLDTCYEAGINVPREIAVLGVNNDEIICRNTTPPLSSVQPDFEEEGYRAAALLDRLMRGEAVPSGPVLCGVRQIVCRQSTVPVSVSGKLVQKAVAYIQTHACRGIGVPDVACHLKVSRRLADLRFRQLQGRSILEAIRQCRLEEVRRLLVDTDLPIGVIGERCGYPNENYLKNLFKARFGLTMRDYRKLGL